MMRSRLPIFYLPLWIAAMTLTGISDAQVQCSTGVCVTTWHNDNLRTGQNTNETTLTKALVGNPNSFGRICSAVWPAGPDNLVYAQPLVVTNVKFNGILYPYLIYIATMADRVYAINGTNCAILGNQSLLEPGEIPERCRDVGGCSSAGNEVGILSTPTIEIDGNNPTTGTLFAVAASECVGCGQRNSNLYYHRLWALDIRSLAPTQTAVQICQNSTCGEAETLFSREHYQRPGLLELPASETGGLGVNVVYVAFSMIDANPKEPNGFILAYDAQNLSASGYPLIYETTPGANGVPGFRGGIWQGAAGLAAGPDTPGGSYYFIYTSTGDGTYDLSSQSAPNMDAGDSLIKLTPSLTYPSGASYSVYSFTPSDSQWRACNDVDFGSSGLLLLPDTSLTRSYAVKADKENYLWTTYRDSLGGYTGSSSCGTCSYPHGCTPGCTACNVANPNLPEPPIPFNANHGATGSQARSTSAFWSGSAGNGDVGELYFAGAKGQLSRYPVNTTCPAPKESGQPPICMVAMSTHIDPSGDGLGYAATPSVSSNTPQNAYADGIVWAIKFSIHNSPVLYAFDAISLTELYDTRKCNPNSGPPYPDQPGTPTHFSVPTIANGYVYIATQTDFDIYGPLTRICN